MCVLCRDYLCQPGTYLWLAADGYESSRRPGQENKNSILVRAIVLNFSPDRLTYTIQNTANTDLVEHTVECYQHVPGESNYICDSSSVAGIFGRNPRSCSQARDMGGCACRLAAEGPSEIRRHHSGPCVYDHAVAYGLSRFLLVSSSPHSPPGVWGIQSPPVTPPLDFGKSVRSRYTGVCR